MKGKSGCRQHNMTKDQRRSFDQKFLALALSLLVYAPLLRPKPSTTAINLHGKYVLDPIWDFDAEPTARDYQWSVRVREHKPNGVYCPMMLVNGQFPGRLIECNEGRDIHVQNQAANATSFDLYGVLQNTANWMDGALGIT